LLISVTINREFVSSSETIGTEERIHPITTIVIKWLNFSMKPIFSNFWRAISSWSDDLKNFIEREHMTPKVKTRYCNVKTKWKWKKSLNSLYELSSHHEVKEGVWFHLKRYDLDILFLWVLRSIPHNNECFLHPIVSILFNYSHSISSLHPWKTTLQLRKLIKGLKCYNHLQEIW
jgi:hypothetical protein